MKWTYLSVIVVAAACMLTFAGQPMAAAAPPGDSGGLLTKDEATEVNAVIGSMLAAGFPDTQKAKIYAGKLSVSATFDPAQGAPLPSSASSTQMTSPNSNKMTYGYTFGGLHFKLADGSWIIALSYRFKPAAGDSVSTADATEVRPATLSADALAAHPFDADKNAGKYLDGVSPPQRERCKAVMNRYIPILMQLNLNPDTLAPAVVLLQRAGWGDAAEFSLVAADQRARNYWQLKPWMTPDPAFDPTGNYPNTKDEEASWRKGHAQYISEPPQVALRRALFRWCRAQIMVQEKEDAMLTLDEAIAATKAAVDAKDPQKNIARIEAMGAGARLPVTLAPGAVLTARLQSWEGRPRTPRMTVSGGHANGGLGISTAFTAPPPAYTPQKSDLDALVALLADERPSRFNDFSGPRTLGDNAWRALAELLKADPRTLAGYPTDHPWTTTERNAAANAVQLWWKTHRTEFTEK